MPCVTTDGQEPGKQDREREKVSVIVKQTISEALPRAHAPSASTKWSRDDAVYPLVRLMVSAHCAMARGIISVRLRYDTVSRCWGGGLCGRTVAAGPRDSLYVDPSDDWTNARAFGARNC